MLEQINPPSLYSILWGRFLDLLQLVGGGSNEAPLSWRDLVDDVCEAQGNKYGQPKPGVLFCC